MNKIYEVIANITDLNRYSYSKLNTIWQCPFSYDLAYNKGIRGNQNGFAECGSLVHEVLEKYLKNELCQFEMTDYFLNNFNRDVPNGVKLKLPTGFKLDLTENYKTQISDFLTNFCGFTIDNHQLEIIGVEKNFLLVINVNGKPIILNGIIDVIGKDDDGNYYILDHKSKKEFKNEQEKQEYTRQLYSYSLYIKYTYGKFPVKLIFDMFRSQTLEVIDFNEDDFNSAIDWISESVGKIENEELYMPIDFKQDLDNFETAQKEVNALKYCYDSTIAKKTKEKYKKVHDDLKDKMFFCGNLCGHSDMCENWKVTLNKYNKIVNGGGKNKI